MLALNTDMLLLVNIRKTTEMGQITLGLNNHHVIPHYKNYSFKII